jgi:hypothetical protein
MPVAVEVAVGSMTNLAVLAVLAAVAQVADSMAHQAPTALLELMDLAAVAVAVLPPHPQRVPVALELSLFVMPFQMFQHPISILPTTLAPTQTTSHQLLH